MDAFKGQPFYEESQTRTLARVCILRNRCHAALGRLRQSWSQNEVAVRIRDAFLMTTDKDDKRELNLLWEQGITPLRDDVKQIKDDAKKSERAIREEIQKIADKIGNTHRWIIGLVLTLIPAYAAVVIAFFRR
jgi:hypothetical protein